MASPDEGDAAGRDSSGKNGTSIVPMARYNPTMHRSLEWIESQTFQGFGCSQCNWKFEAAGSLVGGSLEEMKRKYEAERDKQFAAHVCGEHPGPRGPKIA